MSIKTLEKAFTDAGMAPSREFIKKVKTAYLDGSIKGINLSAFLDRLTDGFLEEGRRITAKREALSAKEKNALTLMGQVIAANLIILLDTNSQEAVQNNLLLLLDYASHALSSSRYDYPATTVRVLSHEVRDLGYDWAVVEGAMSLDIIAYDICCRSKFREEFKKPFSYTGNGHVRISDGHLSICSSFFREDGATAFDVSDGAVRVITRATRDEMLKSSDAFNASALESFAKTFLLTQKESGKARSSKSRRDFKKGDKVTLKYVNTVTGPSGRPSILCQVLESDDSIKGHLKDEELLKGLFTRDLAPYVLGGDCFPQAVITRMEGEDVVFSIKDSYRAYALRKAHHDDKASTVFKAKAYSVREDIGRINWMTPSGYGAISYMMDGVRENDMKVLSVASIQKQGDAIYINVCEPRYGYEAIDQDWVPDDVLLDYVMDIEDALAAIRNRQKDPSGRKDQEMVIRRLASILESSRKENALDRYRQLLCSGFLSCCVGDDAEKAQANATYLKCLIEYAQTGKVGFRGQDTAFTPEQGKILDILGKSQDAGDVAGMAALVDREDQESLSGQVAMLLLSRSLSLKFQDQLKANEADIRKRVCDLLGVGDQFRSSGPVIYGKYGKGEGHQLEFKSSYVFRNDKNEKVADLDFQGRGQVFEAVCGLLNAEGGMVYIGVNDKTGDPITSEDFGLKADMRWLTEHFSTISMIKSQLLRHPIQKPDSMDHYVLFLNSEKELYFKESLQDNIIIEATEDQDAIRITVKPSRFEIAYLYRNKNRTEGVAYKRDGSTTRVMTPYDMEKRMMGLLDLSRTARFTVAIQEAINNKKRLIFRSYASGSSGAISDRHVIPVNLFYNNENVYCYDLDKQVMKQFRIARIGSIEEEEGPVNMPKAKAGQADVFRWILEGKPRHIKIRMAVGARNYLLEEYSQAGNLPKEELYEEKESGKWILDTWVEGFGAIRRFYLGLADKMEILETEDSEALKKDIADFIKANLSSYMD